MSENIDVRPVFSLREFVSLYNQGTLKVSGGSEPLFLRLGWCRPRLFVSLAGVGVGSLSRVPGSSMLCLVIGSTLTGLILWIGGLRAMLLFFLVLIGVCRGSGVQVFRTLGIG